MSAVRLLIALPLLAILLLSVPLAAKATSIQPDLQNVRFEQKLGNFLPLNTTLTDESGRLRRVGEYFGRTPIVLVFTYFRCPNLCTLVLNGLVQALEKIPDNLGQDYQILSISINPLERPSLALAKKYSYLARLGKKRDAAWHFLTGREAEIRKMADAAGFHYSLDPSSGEYSHPSGIIVVAPSGEISKYLFGIQYDSQALHQALLDARVSKKGSWAEEVLLYCFHYDPKQSANGPLIMRVVRIAGGVGALGLSVLLLALFLRKERTV